MSMWSVFQVIAGGGFNKCQRFCHDIIYFSNFLACGTTAQTLISGLATIGKLVETNTKNLVVEEICPFHIKVRVGVPGQLWLFSM